MVKDKKIVLARTKVYGSKLLLIDEGTSAIDEKATLKILKNILQGPETIVFIAHNWLKDYMIFLIERFIYKIINNVIPIVGWR